MAKSGGAPLPLNTILIGNVTDRLREIPDESVHAVVTSPPYWGLRSYKTEPQVWGGDPLCSHHFAETTRIVDTAAGGNWTQAENGIGLALGRPQTRFKGDTRKARVAQKDAVTQGLCKCGAWRGNLGLEPTPSLFVRNIALVFHEVWRVLRPDGLLFMNMGDCYAGSGKGRMADGRHHISPSDKQASNRGSVHGLIPPNRGARMGSKHGEPGHTSGITPPSGLKPKDMLGMPWRTAFALQDDGWWLRSAIIWNKVNPMPESCPDRPTNTYEMIFMMAKSERYYSDMDAVREPLTAVKGVGPEDFARLRDRHDDHFNTGKPGRRHLPGAEQNGLEVGYKMPNKWTNPGGRNLRNVWTFPIEPFLGAFCVQCDTFYESKPERCQCGADPAIEENWLAHFATYPQELVRRCLMIATSEKGVCGECGAPWARVMDEGEVLPISTAAPHRAPEPTKRDQMTAWSRQGGKADSGVMANHQRIRTTLGWEPTCSCNGRFEKRQVDDPLEGKVDVEVYVPAIPLEKHPMARSVVLDPFMGSGTTGLVAAKAARHFIGVELNSQYAEMAKQRIQPELDQTKLF